MGSGLCMIGQGDTGGHTYTKRREQRQTAVLTRQKQDTGNYWSTICLFATKYPQLVYRLKKYIILLISVKTVKSHMLAKLHWRSMHIYIPKHAHMHSCMYEHTHTHMHARTHTYPNMHTCINAFTHTHTHARMHACKHTPRTHSKSKSGKSWHSAHSVANSLVSHDTSMIKILNGTYWKNTI